VSLVALEFMSSQIQHLIKEKCISIAIETLLDELSQDLEIASDLIDGSLPDM
jgi:hypothetical protein